MQTINLTLISPKASDVKNLGQIKSLNSLDITGNNFQSDGLYSVEIFTVSGSDTRNKIFGFIDIKLDIIHPKIFDALTSLSSTYMKIMEGKLIVKFDSKEKDFIIDEDGQTGYQFFLEHIDKIKFKRNNSKKRDSKIDMIYKFLKENKITYNKLLVMPAGLRDYEVTKDGRISEDEINDLYRTVLRDIDLVGSIDISKDELQMIDPIRIKLQKDIISVYDYIKNLIDGKHKFIRGSWTKRGIDYGTRNIFSGIPIKVRDLDDTADVTKPYETIVGVLQASKAFLPLVYFNTKKYFLNDIISIAGTNANLVDIKTLKQKTIELEKSEFEKWSTQDGIDSILNRAIDDEIKNSPIIISGYFLKLIYDDGKEIKLIDDLDLESDLDLKFVRPITYGEFMFITVYNVIKKYPATIARHPVIEEGSTYYTFLKVYSTVTSRTINFINDDDIFYNYPILGKSWINTIGLHYSRLGGLGADHDGDTGPLIGYLTIDAAEEALRKINEVSFYRSVTGRPTMELVDSIVDKTIKTMTMI